MDRIVLIPARGGSKGIPRKNLLDFCGRPLVAWSILQAMGAGHTRDTIFVSTDDDEIASVSQQYGASVINRPAEISGDTATTESAVLHAVDSLKYNGKVMLLQPTSPLRMCKHLREGWEKSEEYDSMFSAVDLGDCCLWKEQGGTFQSVTYEYKARGRRQDREETRYVLENGSFYVFSSEGLRASGNRLHGSIGYYLMEYWTSGEIDSPQDVDACAYLMKSLVLR